MENLPRFVLCDILAMLPVETVMIAARTCRTVRDAAYDSSTLGRLSVNVSRKHAPDRRFFLFGSAFIYWNDMHRLPSDPHWSIGPRTLGISGGGDYCAYMPPEVAGVERLELIGPSYHLTPNGTVLFPRLTELSTWYLHEDRVRDIIAKSPNLKTIETTITPWFDIPPNVTELRLRMATPRNMGDLPKLMPHLTSLTFVPALDSRRDEPVSLLLGFPDLREVAFIDDTESFVIAPTHGRVKLDLFEEMIRYFGLGEFAGTIRVERRHVWGSIDPRHCPRARLIITK